MQFLDAKGADQEHVCYRRAAAFDSWCGNERTDSVTVAASFRESSRTQIVSPNACDPGWVLFDAHCYLYHSEHMDWASANTFCVSQLSSLTSVHSSLENEFLHTLTGGISTWIGFKDVNAGATPVEDYRWTDRSEVDYRNWNSTESENSGKEWHEWDGRDPAPFICKKPSANSHVGIKEVSGKQIVAGGIRALGFSKELPLSELPEMPGEETLVSSSPSEDLLQCNHLVSDFVCTIIKATVNFGSF